MIDKENFERNPPAGIVTPVDPTQKSHWCKDCGRIDGEAIHVNGVYLCAECKKPIVGKDGENEWRKT